MIQKLKIKTLYDDFTSKVRLTDEQIKILNMLIEKKSIVQISMEMGMCKRTTNYEVKKIKEAFQNYIDLEMAKLLILSS